MSENRESDDTAHDRQTAQQAEQLQRREDDESRRAAEGGSAQAVSPDTERADPTGVVDEAHAREDDDRA